MPTERPRAEPYAYAVIGLISCSMLMYEILLTRICSLRLFFHFGFLVVSNCLLGIGAAGSIIFAFQEYWRRRVRFWVWLASAAYLVSLFGTYFFLISFRIRPGIKFRAPEDLWSFFVFNLAAAVPFFFAGAVLGLILTYNAAHVNRIYAVDLIGAGLGCLLTPLLLWKTGAGGAFLFLVVLALAGTVAGSPPRFRRPAQAAGAILGLAGLILLPRFDAMFPVPIKEELSLTRDVELQLDDEVHTYSRWSAISRVDLIQVEPRQATVYGRGENTAGMPVPEEQFILQDGTAGTLILNFSEAPEGLDLLRRTLYAAAARVKPGASVFIIGVGGGNDVWAARAEGARSIRGIELNRQILDIHRGVLRRFSRELLQDPDVELLHGEGRSALMREDREYDVIVMTGIDTWTSLTSGAYMLAENYLYTVEAVQSMYDRLAPGGVLQITRFAGQMETLRLLSVIAAALEERGATDLHGSVVCLYANSLVATLVKKGEFTEGELNELLEFAREAGIVFLYHPRATQDNVVEGFLRADDRGAFIRDFPRDISPTTDDRPYFFNFTRWSDLGSAAKHIDEHMAISQGNPLMIFGQLGLSAVVATAVILLPLLVFRRGETERHHRLRFLTYFTGIGLGFIFIEIALMQKLVLFLGHPIYSITVTLFALLIFTGLGSYLSGRWFAAPTARAWLVPAGLAVLVALLAALSPVMARSWIVLPVGARIAVAVAVMAPVGLLLGVPFAYGIRLLERYNPTLIPWGWAVNACATVVGSVLTVILSMNFGFTFVLGAAVLCYTATFLSVRSLPATSN